MSLFEQMLREAFEAQRHSKHVDNAVKAAKPPKKAANGRRQKPLPDSAEAIREELSTHAGVQRLIETIGDDPGGVKQNALRQILADRNRAWAEEFDAALSAPDPATAPVRKLDDGTEAAAADARRAARLEETQVGTSDDVAFDEPSNPKSNESPKRSVGNVRLPKGDRTVPGRQVGDATFDMAGHAEDRAPFDRVGENKPLLQQARDKSLPDRTLSAGAQKVIADIRDYVRTQKPLKPDGTPYKLDEYIAEHGNDWKGTNLYDSMGGLNETTVTKRGRERAAGFEEPTYRVEETDGMSRGRRGYKEHSGSMTAQDRRLHEMTKQAAGFDPAAPEGTKGFTAEEAAQAGINMPQADSGRLTQDPMDRASAAWAVVRKTFGKQADDFQNTLHHLDDDTAAEMAYGLAHDAVNTNLINTERVSAVAGRDAVHGLAQALLASVGKRNIALPEAVTKLDDAATKADRKTFGPTERTSAQPVTRAPESAPLEGKWMPSRDSGLDPSKDPIPRILPGQEPGKASVGSTEAVALKPLPPLPAAKETTMSTFEDAAKAATRGRGRRAANAVDAAAGDVSNTAAAKAAGKAAGKKAPAGAPAAQGGTLIERFNDLQRRVEAGETADPSEMATLTRELSKMKKGSNEHAAARAAAGFAQQAIDAKKGGKAGRAATKPAAAEVADGTDQMSRQLDDSPVKAPKGRQQTAAAPAPAPAAAKPAEAQVGVPEDTSVVETAPAAKTSPTRKGRQAKAAPDQTADPAYVPPWQREAVAQAAPETTSYDHERATRPWITHPAEQSRWPAQASSWTPPAPPAVHPDPFGLPDAPSNPAAGARAVQDSFDAVPQYMHPDPFGLPAGPSNPGAAARAAQESWDAAGQAAFDQFDPFGRPPEPSNPAGGARAMRDSWDSVPVLHPDPFGLPDAPSNPAGAARAAQESWDAAGQAAFDQFDPFGLPPPPTNARGEWLATQGNQQALEGAAGEIGSRGPGRAGRELARDAAVIGGALAAGSVMFGNKPTPPAPPAEDLRYRNAPGAADDWSLGIPGTPGAGAARSWDMTPEQDAELLARIQGALNRLPSRRGTIGFENNDYERDWNRNGPSREY